MSRRLRRTWRRCRSRSAEVLSPLRSVQRGDVQALWSINVLMVIGGVFWATYRAEKRG